jgi:glycosyltransferase involved in cell wall biosynthesis
VLPISVLVPTRNSMSLLPKHIEGMSPWLDLAEEVVAVDSHSTDGTFECLQSQLKHPAVRVLTHPPGLYQSWNFGIAQCRAKYIYISTVGETITREGLQKLFSTAESFSAEVVISPSRMVKMSGEPKEKIWPIHTLIKALELKAPVFLEPNAVQLFAIANLLRGILGSSASNLYRSTILQQFPFRTDFGTAGDLAWGLEHAGKIRLGVVPETFSTFVFHPKSYAKSDYEVQNFNEKCLALARDSKKSGPGEFALISECLSAWEELLANKRDVAEAKKSALWWASPVAWSAHRRRSSAERQIEQVQQNAMLELSKRVAHDSRPQ